MKMVNIEIPKQSYTAQRPELFFALVGPMGTRLGDLSIELSGALKSFGYRTVDIHLSSLLSGMTGWTPPQEADEFSRISHLQKMGNEFRRRLDDGAALARVAIAEIRRKRAESSGDADKPAPNHAYILSQLKHPAEVDFLRTIYGQSLMIIAGDSPRGVRVEELARDLARKAAQPGRDHQFQSKALELIEADEKPNDDFGQNTRDTFPKADFFANLAVPRGEDSVLRFVDLLFGHPFITPSPDEFAMYQASAASLRSSDDNRQVGAVVVDVTYDSHRRIRNADVISGGMNEVPRAGGGFYWHNDSPDHRDQALQIRGENRAREIKVSTLAELFEKMKRAGMLNTVAESKPSSELARNILSELKGTQFMEIGEFSRPVHAEMAAIVDAARRGVALNGQVMYVTTFPCHNCAKHIIAAGIRRLVYLEPYPKSRAENLHREEIQLEGRDGELDDGKVVFSAFAGVAPRQYGSVFSVSERGKKHRLSWKDWTAGKSSVWPIQVGQNAFRAYLQSEREAAVHIST
jgi:deoxycytidylate deaminase